MSFSHLNMKFSVGYYKNSNEPWDSIKSEEFIGCLNNYQLLNKNSQQS
jgi:hypothetical protein